MNADLTINTKVYTMASPGSSATGSVRKNVTLVSSVKPVTMTIKHQPYVDSATKVAGRRSVVRFDHTKIDAMGKTAVVSVYMVVAQPVGFVDPDMSVLTSVNSLVKHLCMTVCEDFTGGLDLKDEIFDLEQQ